MAEKISFVVKLPPAIEHGPTPSQQLLGMGASWVKVDAILKAGKSYRVTIEEVPEETRPSPA
jgi:hypothetical protein